MLYSIGDKVELKKKHPCGSYKWQIIRVGADIKIKCLGCDRIVMLPLSDFMKMVKRVISDE